MLRKRYIFIFAVPFLLVFVRTAGRALEGAQNSALIRRGPANEKVVALTFDDGPDPRFTPRILSALKERRVRATFFVVGRNAEKYPYLIKLIGDDGNVLGNHTYSHPDLRTESPEEVRAEIEKCDRVLESISGKKPKLFRPPKGFYDRKALQILSGMDLKPILWALTVEHKTCPTPQALASRILEKVQPGDIILAHDGRLDREKTVEAIPAIIDGLKSKGYRFVTVPEMLELLRNRQKPQVHKTSIRADGMIVTSLLRRLHL